MFISSIILEWKYFMQNKFYTKKLIMLLKLQA